MNPAKAPHPRLFIALAVVLFLVATARANAADNTLPMLRVERVPDSDLSRIQGKYFGNNLLVGVRVDLVSNWRAPDGGVMQGVAAVQMQRDANGVMQVSVHTTALAQGNPDGSPVATTSARYASGAEDVAGEGITQVTQLAGNHNVAGNLTQVSFTPTLGSTAGFNGQSYAQAAQGGYTTEVSFAAQGVSLNLAGPNGASVQRIGGDSQGVLQATRVAGDNQATNNALSLQIQTAATPEDLQRQWGVQNALSSLRGLPQ